jgi:ribose/xylose/arabinose/galactoside ABC-type transport system permease subunit
MDIVVFLAAVLAASPPIIFAVMGETITEKAGVINLSLDGSILLSAMAAFVVALQTNSVALGFGAGMAVGAGIALIVAFVSLTLKQPQVATGFVLTLLCRDLAYVLGTPYSHVPGPQVSHMPIPGLVNIPVLGPILFNQNPVVYLSIVAIVLTWAYMYKTQPGLKLQGLGERPPASFVRGVNVTRMRYLYTAVGGALVFRWRSVFVANQTRMGAALRHRGYRLDRVGHCDLRQLATHPCGSRRLLLRAPANAGQHTSKRSTQRAYAGLPDAALPADDSDAGAGDAGQRRVGEPSVEPPA